MVVCITNLTPLIVPRLTKSIGDNMKERDDWPFDKAVQLVNKSLFDHLVSWNKYHSLTAFPQAEHGTVRLRKLGLKTEQECEIYHFVSFCKSWFFLQLEATNYSNNLLIT